MGRLVRPRAGASAGSSGSRARRIASLSSIGGLFRLVDPHSRLAHWNERVFIMVRLPWRGRGGGCQLTWLAGAGSRRCHNMALDRVLPCMEVELSIACAGVASDGGFLGRHIFHFSQRSAACSGPPSTSIDSHCWNSIFGQRSKSVQARQRARRRCSSGRFRGRPLALHWFRNASIAPHTVSLHDGCIGMPAAIASPQGRLDRPG